jgi:hypothetical protein
VSGLSDSRADSPRPDTQIKDGISVSGRRVVKQGIGQKSKTVPHRTVNIAYKRYLVS